jgi:ubiquinol-cytochrome c reductase cytochrome b subunit
LGDVENFIEANPLVTPVHIQPEWYFLFAYAILRCIPNKLGGVIALAMSIIILYFFPLRIGVITKRVNFNPLKKGVFYLILIRFFILTWLGACPVEAPFVLLSQ